MRADCDVRVIVAHVWLGPTSVHAAGDIQVIVARVGALAAIVGEGVKGMVRTDEKCEGPARGRVQMKLWMWSVSRARRVTTRACPSFARAVVAPP